MADAVAPRLPGDGFKVIVCILAHGAGIGVIARLSAEKGILASNVSSGRGKGSGTTIHAREWDEVDILNVAVPAERADEIFEFLYEAAHLDQPHSGIIFQHAVSFATPFTLPDIPAS